MVQVKTEPDPVRMFCRLDGHAPAQDSRPVRPNALPRADHASTTTQAGQSNSAASVPRNQPPAPRQFGLARRSWSTFAPRRYQQSHAVGAFPCRPTSRPALQGAAATSRSSCTALRKKRERRSALKLQAKGLTNVRRSWAAGLPEPAGYPSERAAATSAQPPVTATPYRLSQRRYRIRIARCSSSPSIMIQTAVFPRRRDATPGGHIAGLQPKSWPTWRAWRR